MESEDIFSSIGSFIGGLFGGNKKSKATAAQLEKVTSQVNVLTAENKKQTTLITALMIGVAVIGLIVFVFVILKRRRR